MADELSPKQMVFVTEYLRTSNITAAAKAAGYAEGSAHVTGSKLLKHPKIKQYLSLKETNLSRDLREIFVADAEKAYGVLYELMMDPNTTRRDRLVAARDLLDRAGYKPIDRQVTDINGELTHSYESQLRDLIEET